MRRSSSQVITRASMIRRLKSTTATAAPPAAAGTAPSLFTHSVFNQSNLFENVNLLQSDKIVKESIDKMISSTKNEKNFPIDWKYIENYGIKSGTPQMMEAATIAEKNVPTLRQFDNYGRRIDVIDYHPSYHQLMTHGIESGVCARGFKNNKSGSHIERGVLAYFENQIESGHACPLTMTAAVIPVLLRSLQLANKSNSFSDPLIQQNLSWIQSFVDKIYNLQYDSRDLPIEQKNGVTLGMSMTEKQGGSDVRTNTTVATPLESHLTGIGAPYSLVGHKWFTSAPMCDGFLTLAKTPGSDVPSCFLVPRWLPPSAGSERNQGFQVMRLKNKLADRANASSEVEYRNAFGVMIGEEGKGVKTIIEMVQATRWDCTLGSAGTGRKALQIALNHTVSLRTLENDQNYF
jgi:putative acyl-CoA dehydrogenase